MSVAFQHPLWIAGLAFVPILAYALWMARGPAGMGAPLRATLVALRTGVLMLIVLLLLQPVLRFEQQTTVVGRLPVLIDVSRSMRISDTRKRTADLVEAAAALNKLPWPDADADDLTAANPQAYTAYFSTKEKRDEVSMASRIDLVRGALGHPQMKVFDRLAQHHVVRYYMFAEDLQPIQPGEGLAEVVGEGLGPRDRATALGEAIDRVLARHAGSPIAGIVLLTDGASNAGRPPEAVAQRLAERGIGLFAVGLGLAEPSDVAINDLIVRHVLFTKDLVTIKVRITSSGYEKRSVTLRASLDGTQVASKTVVLAGGAQFERLAFQAGHVPGAAKLAVELSPLSGEATTANNRAQRNVRLIDDKMKVLYIEGSPRWEYRYLRSILKRDRRLEVTFMMTEGDAALARASPDHIDQFPDNVRDAFDYDLVILGDARASTFKRPHLEALEALVRERGGAMLMIAGEDHAPDEYADTLVEQMLPVRIEPGGPKPVSRHVHPVLTAAGRQNMVMTLQTPTARNDTRWSIVRPLGAIPRLAGAKRGAVVLAELSDPAMDLGTYPLIAWHRYGTGKVMFVGTDRLWRLRYKVGDELHTRFWVQAVQFLGLSRLLGENKQVRIETDRPLYHAGDAVQIIVDAMDEGYQPLIAPAYTAQLTRADDQFRQPLTLKPVAGNPGLYQTVYVPTGPGRYTISADDAQQASANIAAFDVTPADAEQADTAMQARHLEQLARTTGGQSLRLIDLPKLAEAIEPNNRTVAVTHERPLWNSWVVLVLFLLLAGGEWLLRRLNGLA